MNLKENVREGLKSIAANKLRTILTALIITFGITSLVGSLTAVDGIQASINSSFANLGANTFDIQSQRNIQGRGPGRKEVITSRLKYAELQLFKDKYNGPGKVSLNTRVTNFAEAKRGTKTSNPNLTIKGGDENFLVVDGYDLAVGRNFSPSEIRGGAYVCIIGKQVEEALFESFRNSIGESLVSQGVKFRIIGRLEEQGGFGDNNGIDRTIVVPMETARRVANRGLEYEATVAVEDVTQTDFAVGVATGVMRRVRGDRAREPDSFEISVSKSLAERLGDITNYLRAAGFGVGAITLLGASIALMNIMLVSVTERTREIGVRKAMGATPAKIRQQFLIESIVICQLGALGGIIFGLAIGNLLAILVFQSPFVVPWIWLIVGLLVAFGVGLLSGFFPASKAANLDPIESLRFE